MNYCLLADRGLELRGAPVHLPMLKEKGGLKENGNS